MAATSVERRGGEHTTQRMLEEKSVVRSLYRPIVVDTIPYHTIPYHTIPYQTIPYHPIVIRTHYGPINDLFPYHTWF